MIQYRKGVNMPIIRVSYYDKSRKREFSRIYNTDTAAFICQTPRGKVYKKPRKCNFYLYNPQGQTNKEKITELPYNEAKELIRQYGTKEQFCEYFSVLNADGSFKSTDKKAFIYIDPIHRVKLFRTASLLSMTPSQCVQYLIDKYDDMRIFNRNFTTHKNKTKNRITPSDISDFS